LKGNLLAGVAAVALMAAAPALAADLPLKVPPAAAAVWSWSGFYVGAHGGYGWGHDSLTDLNDPFFAGKFPNFTVTGFDPKGALTLVYEALQSYQQYHQATKADRLTTIT